LRFLPRQFESTVTPASSTGYAFECAHPDDGTSDGWKALISAFGNLVQPQCAVYSQGQYPPQKAYRPMCESDIFRHSVPHRGSPVCSVLIYRLSADGDNGQITYRP